MWAVISPSWTAGWGGFPGAGRPRGRGRLGAPCRKSPPGTGSRPGHRAVDRETWSSPKRGVGRQSICRPTLIHLSGSSGLLATVVVGRDARSSENHEADGDAREHGHVGTGVSKRRLLGGCLPGAAGRGRRARLRHRAGGQSLRGGPALAAGDQVAVLVEGRLDEAVGDLLLGSGRVQVGLVLAVPLSHL